MLTHASLERLFNAWIALVTRKAWLTIAFCMLLAAASLALTISRIGINTDTTDMLSEELPFRQNHRALTEAFAHLGDSLVVVIEGANPDRVSQAADLLFQRLSSGPDLAGVAYYPEGEGFLRRNGLLYLDLPDLIALSDRLAELQPILSGLSADPSLRGLAEALGLALREADEESALALAPALNDMATVTASLAEGNADHLAWQSLLRGGPPDPRDRRRFIELRPALDFAGLVPADEAMMAVHRVADELGLTQQHGITLRITGEAAMFQEELESVRQGLGWVGIASLTSVFALLVMALRSWWLVAATFVTLIAGLICTAGFATLAVGELNLISVAFAVLFIGLSVDFGIHFALRYKEALAKGLPTSVALPEAVTSLGRPLGLCALSAAIGFFAFLPTHYRGLSELGLISGFGMFIAYFANLTLLPALIALMPEAPGAQPIRGGPLPSLFFSSGLSRRPGIVLTAAVVLGCVASLALPFARFDDDPLALRDPASPSVSALQQIVDDSRIEPYVALALGQDLAAAETLSEDLVQLSEVDAAVTLHDLLPGDQDEKLDIIDEMAFFLTPVLQPTQKSPPDADERRQALEQLKADLLAAPPSLASVATMLAGSLDRISNTDDALLRLEQALLSGLPPRLDDLAMALQADGITQETLPANLRSRFLAADGRALIEIHPSEDLRDKARRHVFVEAVQTVVPGASGLPVIITAAGKAVVGAFWQAGITAFLLITILLGVVLRRFRDVIYVLLPLCLAALFTTATAVLLDEAFNFANVIVLPLLFGLGVASGIHLVTRARETQGNGLATTSTPRAVFFSALTTLASFGALAFSQHPGTASMGLLLTIAISWTLVATLVVLPAMLSFARGKAT